MFGFNIRFIYGSLALVCHASITDGFHIIKMATSTSNFAYHRRFARPHARRIIDCPACLVVLHAQSESSGDAEAALTASSAPTLDGKRVLPLTIITAGIQGHRVPATYAVLNASYKRGSNGWENCEHVGVTQNLAESLQGHLDKHGADRVAHVRSLSFATPDPIAMQRVAKDWRQLAIQAGASLKAWDADVMEYLFDEDDDDDDEYDDDDDDVYAAAVVDEKAQQLAARLAEDDSEDMADVRQENVPADEPVVSPFDRSSVEYNILTESDMPITQENVDKVLNEVRPYLIADGGNVKVEQVDPIEKNVYLKLEGACGSCESSTVTMAMGIERTLRENFADLNQVIRVDSDANKPTELTWKVVEEEVNRLKPAILAMGGQCDIASVDAATGVVDIKFRGASKVRQGLELALLDVPLLNKVNFVMGDD